MKVKKTATLLTAALMFCGLTGTAALAKSKPHALTFAQNISVNGTPVKAGDYQAKFDEQSGELTLLDDNNHVVVTAKAHEMALNKKAADTRYEIKSSGTDTMLAQVTFSGERYTITLDGAGNQSGDGQ